MSYDYTKPEAWDVIWSRPYTNYEKHHQVFWSLIRRFARDRICDLGCGSASCWRDRDVSLVGVDFSYQACREGSKNCPNATFVCEDITKTSLQSSFFDTVVVSGVINYHHDLEPLKKEMCRILAPHGLLLITINVIDDFPDRHWDIDYIQKEFGELGEVESRFYPKIGFFIAIQT